MRRNQILIILLLVVSVAAELCSAQRVWANQQGKQKLAEIDTTLWKYLAATDRSQWSVTREDSVRAVRDYFYQGATIFRRFSTEYKKITQGKLTWEQATPRLIQLLEEVRDYFEQGIQINPFDKNIRRGLTTIYTYLEGLYSRQQDDFNQLQVIKNLLYLEQDRIRRIDLFNRAGNIYSKYELWEPARQSYQNAVTMLFETEEEAEVDTTRLFNNIYLRGMAELKLYQDEPALTSFTRARMIAPDEKWYRTLTGLLDFINWDGGNIRASEKYRDAQNLFRQKRYDDAEKQYLNLIPIVKTEKARIQAQLDLVRLQFYYLKKKQPAIEQLFHIVSQFPLDSTTRVPIDTTKKELWETYSKMCLQLGIESVNSDKKAAFAYLLKCSQIESAARGKAFLNLAIMSVNNPQISLSYCKRALDYQSGLNQQEKKYLYNTLYKAYLKQGEFAEALEWFKKYHVF